MWPNENSAQQITPFRVGSQADCVCLVSRQVNAGSERKSWGTFLAICCTSHTSRGICIRHDRFEIKNPNGLLALRVWKARSWSCDFKRDFWIWQPEIVFVCLLFSRSVTSNSLWPRRHQHARLPCPSLSFGVCSNSCPLSWWYHPTISSSADLFSSCLQSFPAAGSFPMNQLFASGGQSIGASASVLPMNIQGSFPLGLTGLISLLSKGLSRVFCVFIHKCMLMRSFIEL